MGSNPRQNVVCTIRALGRMGGRPPSAGGTQEKGSHSEVPLKQRTLQAREAVWDLRPWALEVGKMHEIDEPVSSFVSFLCI